MPQNLGEDHDSTVVLFFQVMAVVCIFAVPTVVLSLMMPEHSSWIIFGGTYLLFAVAALFAGIGWRDPNYSRQAKTYTLIVLAATVFGVPVWRLIKQEYWEYSDFFHTILIRAASLLSPFLVGLILSAVMKKYMSPPSK